MTNFGNLQSLPQSCPLCICDLPVCPNCWFQRCHPHLFSGKTSRLLPAAFNIPPSLVSTLTKLSILLEYLSIHKVLLHMKVQWKDNSRKRDREDIIIWSRNLPPREWKDRKHSHAKVFLVWCIIQCEYLWRGVGGIAQQLRTCTILQDPSSIPKTYIRWLTTA